MGLMGLGAYGQTYETVTVGDVVVDKFVTGMTVSGDNVSLTYSDGTVQTAELSGVSVDLTYRASLADDATASDANTATLANFGGKTVGISVKRQLTAGQWNVLCLPFSMTADQIATVWGDGTRIATLDYADGEGVNFASQTAIQAGVPYIIQPVNANDEFALDAVLLKNLTAGGQMQAADWTFVGTIPTEQPTGTVRCLTGDGTMAELAAGESVYPLRAYMKANNEIAAPFTTFSVDGDATGIMQIENGNVKIVNEGVFDLNGRYMGRAVSELSLPKGIYIVSGKKMVVK